MSIQIRKWQTTLISSWHDGGTPLGAPRKHAIVGVVIKNPFANAFEPALAEYMEGLVPLATEMAEQIRALATSAGEVIETFGKGAMVGYGGEIEHAAMWHMPGGAALRSAVPTATAGVPGIHRYAEPGAVIHMPLGSVVANNVRSHYDSTGFCVADAPKVDELAFILAFGTGSRVHARLGGVTVAEALQAAS